MITQESSPPGFPTCELKGNVLLSTDDLDSCNPTPTLTEMTDYGIFYVVLSGTMLVLINVIGVTRVNYLRPTGLSSELNLESSEFTEKSAGFFASGLSASMDHLYLLSYAFSPLSAFLRFY